jgi:hypothetical protein
MVLRFRISRAGILLAVILTVLPTSMAVGQQSARSAIHASVTDAKTGLPISSAEVVIHQLGRVALTDSTGRARLDGILTGIYTVRVRRLGYRATSSAVRIERQLESLTFALDPVALFLDTVTVAEREASLLPKAFETRRKLGIGRFLTESQLAKDANQEFALVAMTRFPGVRVVNDMSTGRLRIASTRGNCGAGAPKPSESPPALRQNRLGGGGGGGGGSSCFSARPCFVKMYLDDMQLGDTEYDIVRTWDLAGVEYYTGASMPAQYRVSGSACGVLLLWSKR